ncbi:hypothetical protein A2757_01975 [Candidatus Giovannonibacteria bacterium RIFCSPHIGHO2_01_FULL_48_47]|nr:MAG: hypothetical protein A2757_01975 [Candidatus Giovannonibacteria bacterium RIFCSPHIGHO2_01_FULL_48_47]OGF67937.1 MAG: hypothetical protein A3D61_02485 [Candidatus Giovannonibacteria bacterium RIFCSPHIGHO2_02_FULL_48_15]OGF88880.1 MAG: hypothetical protein A3B26_01185 [Candidatus Giovannonibacteria bacterium RIFCSPLOWO2_01_FULL_48_47]OGF95260.1 MAG: hypothetical protein A2433_01545 [Candidatus Giovannonibacteria bacterium RIFOXYC1_FULL_48_8]OGF96063.1 MAG: hypothetical protein A2613_00630
MGELPGDYIAGFVDGEGCFALKFQREVKKKRKNRPEYFRWSAEFVISLRSDDVDLLKLIKDTLGCGKITFAKNKQVARYSVAGIDNLQKIIVPFFEKHQLFGKKSKDFLLWKDALQIIGRNKRKEINIQGGKRGFISNRWSPADIEKLIKIHESMKPLKSNGKEWKWIHRAVQ